MDLEIEGNAALTTASSSGLGKASAKSLAREGVDVVVNGRDPDRLDEAVSEIEAVAEGEVVGQVGDLTDPDDIEALVERPIEEFGRLDHLVTSAGGPTRYAPLEATDEDWQYAFEMLVLGVVRTVRHAAGHLQDDGGGTIVAITSRSVKQSSPDNVLSSSVRMAVIGLEKTLTYDLGPDVRANALLPGSIRTPRVDNSVANQVEAGAYDTEEEALESRRQSTPLHRIGDPQELGDTAAFLSSPRSGFINGQAILIDGGSVRTAF